jgi:hypothetical protein
LGVSGSPEIPVALQVVWYAAFEVTELNSLIVTVREGRLTRTDVGLLRLQPESLTVLVALDTNQSWKGNTPSVMTCDDNISDDLR